MKNKLLKEAFIGMENSYAPYSNYHVGASLLMKDGKIIQGANIENASFGATTCAEQTAIYTAYTQGYRKNDVLALAVVSDGAELAAPCGICRQVLSELMPMEAPIYLSNKKDQQKTNLKELMPFHFGKKDLKNV